MEIDQPQTMVSETELDFILVRQKDRILAMVSRGEGTEAMRALEVVAELWKTCDYEYKTREILARIVVHAEVDRALARLYAPNRSRDLVPKPA